MGAAACALFRFQGPAWYGCKVQHAVWMLLSSMVCDGVWELLPLPFSGFRGSAWGVGAIGCALYGSGSCGSCCLCPFQGSGASMGEGAWEVGAVACPWSCGANVSPAQEGKMPDMACQGGARMVWEL
jgi:hypothetical protein